MSFKAFDIAIVGQGIAGTLMAYFLQKRGKKVLIIDNNFDGAASKVAAGIVNPITGKKFVKSWRVDEFLPFAYEIYAEMGTAFGILPFTKANIIRALDSVEDENNWLSRTADESINGYMAAVPQLAEYEGKVTPAFGYGEITGTFHVHMSKIMDAFKSKCIADVCYLETKFVYDLLKKDNTLFRYADFTFNEIVFCEGHQAVNNPFFKDIGLGPSKGEVLMVKIPGAGFTKMYKDRIFIVHQYDDVYWVGSGYEWNAKDDLPTQKSLELLSSELNRVLKIPFEIIGHKAAIRPTMHHRRPVFRVHENIEGMYLFNGLGTKGASVGPFAANQFARYLVDKNPDDLVM